MKFYNRSIFDELKGHLPKRQITVLTDMRRTGKTTLVKQLLRESGIEQQFYFDLERIDIPTASPVLWTSISNTEAFQRSC